MIYVVIDANVFVSGVITSGGKSAQILNLIQKKKIELITSAPILEETRKVLLRPHIKEMHGFSAKQIDKKLMQITRFAKTTLGKVQLKVIQSDLTDNKYLECAVEGEVDYIISGDKHLKGLKEYQGIKVLNPAAFLNLVKKGK
ncbi:MAG: putative toxin-antitoxin system toxin component, PIN family [Nitrospinota bacterium]